VGGAFLLYMGARIAFDAHARAGIDATRPPRAMRSAHAFLTTFALTLSNPMTILSFVAIFAALGATLDSIIKSKLR